MKGTGRKKITLRSGRGAPVSSLDRASALARGDHTGCVPMDKLTASAKARLVSSAAPGNHQHNGPAHVGNAQQERYRRQMERRAAKQRTAGAHESAMNEGSQGSIDSNIRGESS